MAYINRLSDINNKLDTNIENQTETNSKLANIDDNMATLNTNIKNSFDSTNNALKVNIVVGGSGGSTDTSNGKSYLYNGIGDTAITATALSASKNGIDTASSMYVSNGTTITALTATAITASKNGIDTASVLYISDGTNRTALTSTAVTASKNGIDTASVLYVIDGTNITALTGTNNALDVNIKSNNINRLGSYNNFLNNINLNANTYSSSFNIDGYNNCILSYFDTQNLSDTIIIFGSLNNTDFFHIGLILPIYNSNLLKRFASTKLNLAPITYIKLYNTSATDITSANCTIVSS
jgi:hypothetical protein